MKPFNWTCPYCNTHTTITEARMRTLSNAIDLPTRHGELFELVTVAAACPNPNCMELILKSSLSRATRSYAGVVAEEDIESWSLRPGNGRGRPLPGYIPQGIAADYREANLIKDLSPKASATLARRCLQGMIRDFWKIQKGTLFEEIQELEKHVDASIWAAIHVVRKIGNIGAHMEKDINVMIDVDPEEAEHLIQLLDTLIEDWYVKRHQQDERLRKLQAMADAKEAQRKGA
jgi:hypothetical protein